MPDELANIGEAFTGLPISDLIAGPILAACDAQVILAKAAAQFIDDIGLQEGEDGSLHARTVDFTMNRPVTQADGSVTQSSMAIQAPLLAIVNVPSLSVKHITVDFEMEVKSSFQEKTSKDASASLEIGASGGWGPVKASAKFTGSVSSHKENTRSSDNRAKYSVHVEARDDGMPEGLSRLLDIMNDAVAVSPGGPAPAIEAAPATKKKS